MQQPKVVPMAIHTPWASVVVFGHELLAKWELNTMFKCLASNLLWEGEDHGVRMISVNNDGEPRGVLANCQADCGAVIINLRRTFEYAIRNSKKDPRKSILACWHQLMIQNVLHEAWHLSKMLDPADRARYLEMEKNIDSALKVEREAEFFSLDAMYLLAKNVDIEPGLVGESPFLANELLKLFGEKNDEWSKNQRRMLEDRIFYRLPAEPGSPGMSIFTFKNFCRLLSDEKGEEADKEWAKPTIEGVGKEQDMGQLISEVAATLPAEKHDVGPVTASPANMTLPPAIANLVANPPAEVVEEASINDDWDDGMPANSEPSLMESYEQHKQTETSAAPAPAVTTGVQPKFCSNCGAAGPFPANATGCHACLQPFGAVVGVNTPPIVSQGPVAKIYEETGLESAQTGAIARAVYIKVFNHIFTQCGFAPGNGDLGFTNPEGVFNTIPLTPQEQMVVVGMDAGDINGRFSANAPTTGGLRGFIMKNAKLPAYILYLNDNGVQKKRLLLPQNPAKRTEKGDYTKTALQARGGTKIMYTMEANDDIVKAGGKKFYPKCVDYVWQD